MATLYVFRRSTPIALPLAVSVVATGIAAATLCTPPAHLHSWTQVVSLATLFLSFAGVVHVLTVLTIFRIIVDEEFEQRTQSVFPVMWASWIVIVWLPLLALLTSEHSAFVAIVLPVIGLFTTLLLHWTSDGKNAFREESTLVVRELFALPRGGWSQRASIFKIAIPAILLEIGLGILAVGHAWIAGCCLAGVAAYVTKQIAPDFPMRNASIHRRSSEAAVGNTVTVWLLLAVALLPFLVGFSSGMLGFPGMPKVHSLANQPITTPRAGKDYVSVILFQPAKPRPVVAPDRESSTKGLSKPKEIPFDGAYWYFQEPDKRPTSDAHIIKGDPIKERVRTTNRIPLVMEAHQQLRQGLDFSCCRSLRVRVLNGDASPGLIALEVLLADESGKNPVNVSLGSKVLVSSTASPMPLDRKPVTDSLIFAIPSNARNKAFDTITVRVKPQWNRSLAGAKVKIQSFAVIP